MVNELILKAKKTSRYIANQLSMQVFRVKCANILLKLLKCEHWQISCLNITTLILINIVMLLMHLQNGL